MKDKESTYSLLQNEDIFLVNEPISGIAKAPEQEKFTKPVVPAPKAMAKNILFIVNTKTTGAISEREKDVIARMLKSLGLPGQEVELIGLPSDDACRSLIEGHDASKVTVFGFPGLDREFATSGISEFKGKKILNTQPLLNIDTDKDLKKAFWVKLQELIK